MADITYKLTEEIERKAKQQIDFIMANRELLVQAFLAETGLLPSECELVEERHPMNEDYVVRTVVYVRKRIA